MTDADCLIVTFNQIYDEMCKTRWLYDLSTHWRKQLLDLPRGWGGPWDAFRKLLDAANQQSRLTLTLKKRAEEQLKASNMWYVPNAAQEEQRWLSAKGYSGIASDGHGGRFYDNPSEVRKLLGEYADARGTWTNYGVDHQIFWIELDDTFGVGNDKRVDLENLYGLVDIVRELGKID